MCKYTFSRAPSPMSTSRLLSLAVLGASLLAGCSSGSYRPGSYDRAGRTADRTAGRTADRAYPASARTSENGQSRYVLCHNGRTQTFPVAAVEAHVGHGDRFGACARDDRDTNGRGNGRGNARGNGRGNGRN